jgi:non-specific serine/threonine protein kinase/serine/threonine-protein kinase
MEPKSIGPYQLIRRLGEGGMGQVWLAEQTTPIQRQVALKLIKVGRYDDSVLQRFYAERQSLAIMEHPAIARVFDAGTTPDGQPYFVMEYVPGVHITDYCDRKRLKIRERLELFVKVCEGVQHAHQKAIMHRDLKPANILVVEVDGKPVPRIIDFGLAKAASPQMDGQTMFTQVGGWVGTPGYMSPEQADPSVLDVDTRTDVYSLGAELYELLTGFLPFESKDWRKQPFDEFLRRLREEDPPRPSTKVDTEKGSSKTTAEVRGTDHKQLVRLLHGDLDWITMKALEKDRTRRYGTPSELAADIQRYLSDEPVVARPARTGYRLRKYARRHRMGVGVAAGLVLLLAGFAAMQATQLQRITRERDRADREATAAKSVSDFQLGLFEASDPSRAKGSNVTARELLDRGRGRIETGLADQPELQARMLDTIGRVYLSLGFTQEARPLIERALETRQRLLGPEHPDTLTSLDHLGQVLEKEGRFAEAEKLIRTTLDARTRVLGPTHPDTLASRHAFTIVTIDRGDYVGGEKLNREELGILRRVRGPDHPDTVLSMYSLAVNLADEGKPDDAVAEYREALEISRRALGPLHPTTLRIMYSMGGSLADQQKYDEAESCCARHLKVQSVSMGLNTRRHFG